MRITALRPLARAFRAVRAASFRVGARRAAAGLLALWLSVPAGGGSLAFAVDANTASADELQTIRGIGPAMAARILEARRNDPFRDLDDLRERVRGIGEKNLRRMREAGLEVGAGAQLVDTLGQGRVHEEREGSRGREGASPPVVRSGDALPPRPRVEYHIGRAR